LSLRPPTHPFIRAENMSRAGPLDMIVRSQITLTTYPPYDTARRNKKYATLLAGPPARQHCRRRHVQGGMLSRQRGLRGSGREHFG
jgi:hypothetical protein